MEQRLITAFLPPLLQRRHQSRHEGDDGGVPVTDDSTSGSIILPALRGVMGDWVYYCCLVDLPTLASRVGYADAAPQQRAALRDDPTPAEGEPIQGDRQLPLATQPDRLFNALVVATYGGQPNWHPLTNVQKKGNPDELGSLTSDTTLSVGFLTLRGDERALRGRRPAPAVRNQGRRGGARRPCSD